MKLWHSDAWAHEKDYGMESHCALIVRANENSDLLNDDVLYDFQK
jgi:hypothetical protein